ncbi:MAG: ubiquinone-binding protein [Legionellaceae bacterium]|nr:ubiquinone-binding protein [Legionellaceae bacterium]HCA89550.1 ubiquinone-binding protein [Legionellales bacterium]|tara:strand:+ start:1460 stop:1888 length:429 start_codon:yes stop_codon:yes gene_type:complete
MTVVKKSRVVQFSCAQMYELVNDVERYSEFLPYCSASHVIYRDADMVKATLVIAAAGMKKSFTTSNHQQLNKMIEIRLVDGPFKHLQGFWRFDEVDRGCRIVFDLEFEFAGRMFSMLLGPIFEQITDKMVDAFCMRAEKLYG